MAHRVCSNSSANSLTIPEPRDGGCSGSTLEEAASWGKVDANHEQIFVGQAIDWRFVFGYHGEFGHRQLVY